MKTKKHVSTSACLNCLFFIKTSMQDEMGVCRRFPPQVIVENEEIARVWPDVHPAEYCGEWKADQ